MIDTLEADGSWSIDTMLWPLKNIVVLYAAISMRSSLHLPTFIAALFLSIPPMLLLHAVYATRPSKNILIYTTYVYACTLVAKYIEWRSGLANTTPLINAVVSSSASLCAFLPFARLVLGALRLHADDDLLKFLADEFEPIMHDTLLILEEW